MKVGYVPEHFSTPLFFAQQQGFYDKHNVQVEFVPFPSGTGHMIQSLKDKSIDTAIGLTEGFVAGIGKGSDWYKIVGTYVKTPLCWAISTGANRDIQEDGLEGKTIGVSRIGSGSYVMPFVLAQQKHWDGSKFTFVPQGTFENLRKGVNHAQGVEQTDAFMWEIFTTKKYYDNGELKKVGKILTPWPSWVIAAHTDTVQDPQLKSFFKAVNEGVEYFKANQQEAVKYISTNLDYSAEDATAWLDTVEFVSDVGVVDQQTVINNTVSILKQANVLEDGAEKLQYVG